MPEQDGAAPESKIVGISGETAEVLARAAAQAADVEVVPVTAHEGREFFDEQGIPFGD